jgi:hypothetical protein
MKRTTPCEKNINNRGKKTGEKIIIIKRREIPIKR